MELEIHVVPKKIMHDTCFLIPHSKIRNVDVREISLRSIRQNRLQNTRHKTQRLVNSIYSCTTKHLYGFEFECRGTLRMLITRQCN